MSFKEIIGHRRPIRLLQKALLSHHLPHAYLFTGPDGVGKRLVALALAKALNCEEGGEDCCEECLACKKVADFNHPDVSLIGPDGQFIKIEQIRQLQRSLSFRPFEGRKRVCIIDKSDRMTPESANALLKTLEEPPTDTLLILLATEKDLLLPTIVSRCQQVAFGSLTTEQMVEELIQRSSLERQEARTIAALSQGSLGKGLEMMNLEVWDRRPEIIQNLIDLPAENVQRAFAIAESWVDLGDSLPLAFPIMMSWYRDLIVWNERKELGCLINQDFHDEVRKAAARMTRRSLMRRIEAIGETSRGLSQNVNRLLAAENLALQLR
jgi:DNA polymerase-3 subunit delta'